MPTLLPFRRYSDHDVLPYFTFSGQVPVNKGTFVRVAGSGFRSSDADTNIYSFGPGASYQNVTSPRFGVSPFVVTAQSGETPLGMLLYDIKETDENGEKYIFKPQKAAENEVALSGQGVPIVTRGEFMYSGISEAVTANQTLYLSGGQITATNVGGGAVAKALGAKDSNGWCLIRIDL